jgi:hypothetical protein
MFKAYCNGKLIHDNANETLRIYNDRLDLELGKSGLFEFTIYPDHPYFDTVEVMTSRIRVLRRDTIIFDGRVLKIAHGFHNEKRVSCEGALAYLLDSIVEPTAYYGDNEGYFRRLLQTHNAQVGADKQFQPGNFSLAYYMPFEVSSSTYTTTLDEINSRIIKDTGGYLQVRHENGVMYLDALASEVDISNVSGQPIEFGKNLLDIRRETDGSEIFSSIVPLGADVNGARVTISDVNNWKINIVYQPAVDKYGLIHKVVTFDGITDPQVLMNTANLYLRNRFEPEDTIEIDIVDISGLDEKTIDSFIPGQWAQVYSKHHLTQSPALYLVRKVSICMSDPMQTRVFVGRLKSGITDNI